VLPDGSFTTTQRSVGIANGIAFSPAGDTMYFADSERRTVWAYDYDPATGDATGERVFVELGSELPGKPDGATVDEDGCYWLACVYGWSLARITPRGDVDRVVEMPVENPSKPAFGGSDLDVLYVTTIGSGGTEPTVTHQADDGAVFAVDAGVRGLPEPTFAAERPARSGG
jgi:sugar lactone lactonase YvrE